MTTRKKAKEKQIPNGMTARKVRARARARATAKAKAKARAKEETDP
jgi:hypothetical protein